MVGCRVVFFPLLGVIMYIEHGNFVGGAAVNGYTQSGVNRNNHFKCHKSFIAGVLCRTFESMFSHLRVIFFWHPPLCVCPLDTTASLPASHHSYMGTCNAETF